MKSWAIPKGPSLDPRFKRLAVEVEDHDLAYADFEGMIEEGQYGAGAVLVWDTEWFEPVGEKDSLTDMWKVGTLDVILHGRRLHGRFAPIRMKDRSRHWLLIKQRDDEARSDPRITMMQEWDTAVLMGRTIEDLEQATKVER